MKINHKFKLKEYFYFKKYL